MDIAEEKVAALEDLPARVSAVERELKEFRVEVRQEFAAVRAELRAGDEETRRYMRVLHEDLVDRLKILGEGFDPNRH